MKITKEIIRTIATYGYEIEIERQLATASILAGEVIPTPYEGMTRLEAKSIKGKQPLAAPAVFTTSEFFADLRDEDIAEFVAHVELMAADRAEEGRVRLSTMHPDERRLAELMARQSEWGFGSREAYEAGCAFAGVEAHSDDEILRGSYGIRYADYYMSHYGDRRWKLIMGQTLAASRLRVIEESPQEDPIDDLLYGGMDDVSLLSRDLRADPYGEG